MSVARNVPKLPVARNVPKLPVTEVHSNEFQRPNPKGMTSRISQERIDVL